MEEAKKPAYKYCMVPECKNTMIKTPDKAFFRIPYGAETRKLWCKVMRRDNVSLKSCLYCCEDHFNVEEDTTNYIKHNIMKQQGEKCSLRLKKGIVPHIFLCQKRNMPPPVQRMDVVNTQRLTLVNEALSEISFKSSNVLRNDEPSQRSDHEVIPITSHTNVCDINQSGPSTFLIECDDHQVQPCFSHIKDNLQSDKAVQVNIKPKYRSKSVNVNISTAKQNVALSPIPLQTHNIGASPVKLSVLRNSEPSQRSDHEVIPITSHTNVCDINQSGPSTFLIECDDHQVQPCFSHIKDNLQSDKAVQVNIKPKYRSKSVNVNISTAKQNVALSPIPLQKHNIGTSPVKLSVLKRKLFTENTADSISISSYSSISADYQPSCLSESSEAENDSEEEKHFKNVMCSSMLIAIEKEPKMLLGLPKQSYHLIKLLSDNIPLPTKHILITLKKIKLNESFSILGLQFGYSQSTITRIFSKSIPLIAVKLKDLIVWPASSDIYKNLPISFRYKYANVISIIDCLEIQIEKPSDAVHQSLTWSQYKKCNTLKYLISCTPDGLINFISEGYGGRATDVIIVQDSNYLQFLPPNKAVMADRGFKDLSCLLEAKRCSLIRPPSVSKSTPSTKDEVKLSKCIGALRIHVERVINRLREFHMLLPHASIDHNLIPIIDHVIIVACGLVNMQDVLIKK